MRILILNNATRLNQSNICICKYVNKGREVETKQVSLLRTKLYESGRYISNSEAAWRIFGFPIHERHPTVVHLAVYLQNGQRIYFTENNLIDKVSNPSKTKLLAFLNYAK